MEDKTFRFISLPCQEGFICGKMFFPRANLTLKYLILLLLLCALKLTKQAELYTGRVGEYLRCKVTCVTRSCRRINFILGQKSLAAWGCCFLQETLVVFPSWAVERSPSIRAASSVCKGKNTGSPSCCSPPAPVQSLEELLALPALVLLFYRTRRLPQCQQCYWSGAGPCLADIHQDAG